MSTMKIMDVTKIKVEPGLANSNKDVPATSKLNVKIKVEPGLNSSTNVPSSTSKTIIKTEPGINIENVKKEPQDCGVVATNKSNNKTTSMEVDKTSTGSVPTKDLAVAKKNLPNNSAGQKVGKQKKNKQTRTWINPEPHWRNQIVHQMTSIQWQHGYNPYPRQNNHWDRGVCWDYNDSFNRSRISNAVQWYPQQECGPPLPQMHGPPHPQMRGRPPLPVREPPPLAVRRPPLQQEHRPPLQKKEDKDNASNEVQIVKEYKETNIPKDNSTNKKKNITVSVVPDCYPKEVFTERLSCELRQYLFKRLQNTPNPLPEIRLGPYINAGAKCIYCEGKVAAEWLRKTVNGEIIGGVKLKIVTCGDLFQPVKVSWKYMKVQGVTWIERLEMLKAFYNELRVGKWKLIKTVDDGETSYDTVMMDRKSSMVIRKHNFCLHAGLEDSYFTIVSDVMDTTISNVVPKEFKMDVEDDIDSDTIETNNNLVEPDPTVQPSVERNTNSADPILNSIEAILQSFED